MRKVFTPPKTGGGWLQMLLGAVLITFGIFLVLPLTQMLSSAAKKELSLLSADVVLPPPPPPPTQMEEEPPPEEKPDEPKLEMAPENQPLNLGIPDLDLAVGTGGALAGAFAGLDSVTDAAKGMAIFDISELDTKPVPLAQVSPVHPRELLKARVEGNVVLVFVVDENGQVTDPRVEQSSRPDFERPALDAVRKWRFRPGVREGQPVKTYVRQPIRFSISS